MWLNQYNFNRWTHVYCPNRNTGISLGFRPHSQKFVIRLAINNSISDTFYKDCPLKEFEELKTVYNTIGENMT